MDAVKLVEGVLEGIDYPGWVVDVDPLLTKTRTFYRLYFFEPIGRVSALLALRALEEAGWPNEFRLSWRGLGGWLHVDSHGRLMPPCRYFENKVKKRAKLKKDKDGAA